MREITVKELQKYPRISGICFDDVVSLPDGMEVIPRIIEVAERFNLTGGMKNE